MEVTGLDKLLNTLRDLSDPKTVDAACRRGLRKAGKAVQASAKRLVHVDTGQLRNSIEVTDIPNGVDVGTNVKQGFFEEYGVGKRGDPSVAHTSKEQWSYQDEDGNWHTTSGHEPHPFLFPAVEMNKDKIPEIIKAELQKEIRERAGR